MEKFSLLRAHANDDETKPTKIVQNRKLYISGKVFTHAPMMNRNLRKRRKRPKQPNRVKSQ